MFDLDGVPRVTADRNDRQRRIKQIQHMLRMLNKARLDDFVGRTALRLDSTEVRGLLQRYRSDLDLRLTIPDEYISVARLHEITELLIYEWERNSSNSCSLCSTDSSSGGVASQLLSAHH